MKYSILSLARNALSYHERWPLAWKSPRPKRRYDAVIVGGGGHGLATAYYLAKEHRLTNVAVLEKGYLGGGNTGRNTTIVRSNYHLDPNAHFYEFSLKLWESLSQELNFNVMYSARGVLNLVHSPADMDAAMRRGNAMRLNGIDATFLSRDEIARRIPNLDCSPDARFPIHGGLLQPRGGTVRHDAVAWGYARGADARGVDIIQQCEVTAIRIVNGAVAGVETTQGYIETDRLGLAVAGHSGRLAAMAGLQAAARIACVAGAGVRPREAGARHRRHLGRGALLHQPVRQGRTGDGGRPRFLQLVCAARQPADHRARRRRVSGAVPELQPPEGHAHLGRCVRHDDGRQPDHRQVAGARGSTMTGGWCYGGFKATPASGWLHAYTIARDEPHPKNAAFTLERFARGQTIDEKGAGPVPWAH